MTPDKEELRKTRQVSYVRSFRLEEKVCPQCSTTFTEIVNQVYCSKPCQKKADYERHAEQYRAKRREKYERQKAEKLKTAKPVTKKQANA